MKNNYSRFKTLKMKELSSLENMYFGKLLEELRNTLLLKPEDLADVLSISTNTIKKAERGGNVGIEVLGELIFFYGFTFEEFYSLKQIPHWKELVLRIETFHKKHRSQAYKILYKKPNLIDLIEFRLLKTDFFDKWMDEQDVIQKCEKEYGFKFDSATNTLNNAVTKGWLISNDRTKPKKYKKNE